MPVCDPLPLPVCDAPAALDCDVTALETCGPLAALEAWGASEASEAEAVEAEAWAGRPVSAGLLDIGTALLTEGAGTDSPEPVGAVSCPSPGAAAEAEALAVVGDSAAVFPA